MMTTTPSKSNTVILVTNNGMGNTVEHLQHKLFRSYVGLLNQSDLLPAAICFYADGVNMVVEGAPALEELAALEEKGVRLIVCNTCLKTLDLKDKLAVGIVGGMPDIIEAQWMAEKVITI
jgi:intracellular sulfur oxidation DsrE/DsrF family protein